MVDAGELGDGCRVVLAGASYEHVGGDGGGVAVGSDACDFLDGFEEDGFSVGATSEGEGEDLFEDFSDQADAEEALDVGGEVWVAGEGVGEELVPAWCGHGGVDADGGGAGVECCGCGCADGAGFEVDDSGGCVEGVGVGVEGVEVGDDAGVGAGEFFDGGESAVGEAGFAVFFGVAVLVGEVAGEAAGELEDVAGVVPCPGVAVPLEPLAFLGDVADVVFVGVDEA